MLAPKKGSNISSLDFSLFQRTPAPSVEWTRRTNRHTSNRCQRHRNMIEIDIDFCFFVVYYFRIIGMRY